MPLMNGFELLGKLHNQPLVVFTTAYDEYALKAFEVNAVDYLLKPIEASDLERALNKMERFYGGSNNGNDLRKLVETLSQLPRSSDYLTRIASRLGDRVCFVDLARVTHFYADEKLTYAAADGKSYCLDHTISGLEEKLDSRRFIRIHRATLVNIDWIKEIAPGFKGNLIVRLKDANRTELTVARNRVHDVKKKLGI